jgi:hypothetical protein
MSLNRSLPRTAALMAAWSAALLLTGPGVACAGVVYQLSFQPVDQSLAAPTSGIDATPAPVLTEYFVDHANVRIGGQSAKTVFLFKAETMTVVDTTQRTCHVLQRATTAAFLTHYADEVRLLEEAAARAPADAREEAEQKAADMRAISERLQSPIERAYKVTVRFDAVDGRACRIWEERENGAKRLEICVAAAARVPGGAQILAGMKTLSRFHEGGQFAIGVDFGFSDWWPDFSLLGGVPLLIHEFKYDSIVAEIAIKGIRDNPSPAPSLEPPADCRLQDGPDYAQWYVR